MPQITPEQQSRIIQNIRDVVPDKARGAGERRHTYVVGAIFALNAIDPEMVPPQWTALALSGRTNELFRSVAKPKDNDLDIPF